MNIAVYIIMLRAVFIWVQLMTYIIRVILECINILNILIHNILACHLYTFVAIFPAHIIVIYYELIVLTISDLKILGLN